MRFNIFFMTAEVIAGPQVRNSGRIWTLRTINVEPTCEKVCLKLGMECGIKTTTPEMLFWCDPNWCTPPQPQGGMVDELGRDWAVDQRWTVKTFNRGRTCKAVCKYHMELCMTIETCPRVYGCDDAKRSRHGPVKKGKQCQRVFKVYPDKPVDHCKKEPCHNDGTCKLVGNGFECTCMDGYSGHKCQDTPCSSKPCGGNGKCDVKVIEETEVKHTFECTCFTGFSGNQCERSPCDVVAQGQTNGTVSLCRNGGSCAFNVNPSLKTWTTFCTCPNGYTGEHCQDDICQSSHHQCQHGNCINKPDNPSGYECACHNHYHGVHCTESACLSNPCFNGAECSFNTDGTAKCTCLKGYSGDACQYDSCHGIACNDAGRCVIDANDISKHSCDCDKGFTGDECQFDSCSLNGALRTCSSHGTCKVNADDQTKSDCDCWGIWVGDDCDMDCKLQAPMEDCNTVRHDMPCHKIPSQWPAEFTRFKIDRTMAMYYPPSDLTKQPLYLPKKVWGQTTYACCGKNTFLNLLETWYSDFTTQDAYKYYVQQCSDIVTEYQAHGHYMMVPGFATNSFIAYCVRALEMYTDKGNDRKLKEAPLLDASPDNERMCVFLATYTINFSGNVLGSIYCEFFRLTRPATEFNAKFKDKTDQKDKYCLPAPIRPPCDNPSDNPCQNGGTCTNKLTLSHGYECTCQGGFSGVNCQDDPCAGNPCQNQATCSGKAVGVGYTCNCVNGFTGVHCADDACHNNPCQNGGTCQLQPATSPYFTCQCTAKYEGVKCETSKCALNCMNGGTCQVKNGNQFCSCTNRYTGDTCQYGACKKDYCGYWSKRYSSGRVQGGYTMYCDWEQSGTCGPNGKCKPRKDRPGEECQCVHKKTGEPCTLN